MTFDPRNHTCLEAHFKCYKIIIFRLRKGDRKYSSYTHVDHCYYPHRLFLFGNTDQEKVLVEITIWSLVSVANSNSNIAVYIHS